MRVHSGSKSTQALAHIALRPDHQVGAHKGAVVERTPGQKRAALRGRLVDSEHPLFVVGDLSKLWLFVHAFERDALRAHPGAKATVSFPALPGQNFPATVALVDRSAMRAVLAGAGTVRERRKEKW